MLQAEEGATQEKKNQGTPFFFNFPTDKTRQYVDM